MKFYFCTALKTGFPKKIKSLVFVKLDDVKVAAYCVAAKF